MRCEGCGLKAPALKTVRWRTEERCFVLCDICHTPLCEVVWIVAGVAPVHGKCRGCEDWFSLRELEDLRPGGKWDAPSGVCASCRLQ